MQRNFLSAYATMERPPEWHRSVLPTGAFRLSSILLRSQSGRVKPPVGTKSRPARRVVQVSLLFLVASCASAGHHFSTDWTTYPRGERQELVSSRIGGIEMGGRLALFDKTYLTERNSDDSLYFDYYRTVNGDDATIETIIFIPDKANASFRELDARAKEKGVDFCLGDARIIASTFYFGDEATPRMYGLGGRNSMKIKYRCSLEFSADTATQFQSIIDTADVLKDDAFFDILVHRFYSEPAVVAAAVNANASNRRFYIDQFDVNALNEYVIIGSHNLEDRGTGGRREQFAMIIRPDNDGSIIEMIFAAFMYRNHQTSVLKGISDERLELVPWPRDVAFRRAEDFLAAIEIVNEP